MIAKRLFPWAPAVRAGRASKPGRSPRLRLAQHAVLNSSCTPSVWHPHAAPQCELPRCCGERFRTRRTAVSLTGSVAGQQRRHDERGNHDGGTGDKGERKILSVTTLPYTTSMSPAASPYECVCGYAHALLIPPFRRAYASICHPLTAVRPPASVPAILTAFPVCARVYMKLLLFFRLAHTLHARRAARQAGSLTTAPKVPLSVA